MKTKFMIIRHFALIAIIFSGITVLNQNNISAQEFHGGQTPPGYKEGNKALKEFIDDNLIFPDSIKKTGIAGTVTVKLLIDKDGKVENVKLMRGINEYCDSEAIRIARLLQGWEPAKNWGKPVSCGILLPIEFRNENNNSNIKQVFVTGVVTDKYTGKPVQGALIVVKGTNIGTITDINGKYGFKIPGENTDLQIFSMGYATRTEQVRKNRTINVELDTEYYTLDLNSED